MSRTGYLLVTASLAFLLSACTGISPSGQVVCTSTSPCSTQTSAMGAPVLGDNPPQNMARVVDRNLPPPIIINATGYSAPLSGKSSHSKAQARLMSLRGSKLDAYRNLLERVYGLKIDGSSSLSNMATQHDELRAYINAYLVGAKVISQRELEDGTFETVVEMALQENFRQCVSSPESIASNPNCQASSSYVRPSYNSNAQKKTAPTTKFYSVQ